MAPLGTHGLQRPNCPGNSQEIPQQNGIGDSAFLLRVMSDLQNGGRGVI